jgi:hypothetical protein
VVQYLAEHCLEFRGRSASLYEQANGSFLGLTEKFAKFDATMQEHV